MCQCMALSIKSIPFEAKSGIQPNIEITNFTALAFHVLYSRLGRSLNENAVKYYFEFCCYIIAPDVVIKSPALTNIHELQMFSDVQSYLPLS